MQGNCKACGENLFLLGSDYIKKDNGYKLRLGRFKQDMKKCSQSVKYSTGTGCPERSWKLLPQRSSEMWLDKAMVSVGNRSTKRRRLDYINCRGPF